MLLLIFQSMTINLKNAKFLKKKLDEKINWSIEMRELSKLPNIGKVVEEQLNEVGINTVDELIDIGSKEAC